MKKILGILLILSSLLLTIFLVAFGALFFIHPYYTLILIFFIFLDFLIIYSGITLFKGNKFNMIILFKGLGIGIFFTFFIFVLGKFTKEVWHYIIPSLILSWFLTFLLGKIFKK